MPITSSDQVVQQWDAIYNALTAEQNYGANGPGTGTNTTGRLQLVKTIDKCLYPDFNALPFVGVQFKRVNEVIYAMAGRHKLTAVFHILVVADAKASGTETFLSVSAAMANLRTLMSDGNGNGVVPVLRDKLNFTWGGTADQTDVVRYDVNWAEKPDSKGTDYVSFCLIELHTISFVQT